MVAEDLARETHLPEEVVVFEDLKFCFGHTLRFAFEVLDPAGDTTGVGAATVVVAAERFRLMTRALVRLSPVLSRGYQDTRDLLGKCRSIPPEDRRLNTVHKGQKWGQQHRGAS